MDSVSETPCNESRGPHRRIDAVPRKGGDRARSRNSRSPAGALWSLVISVMLVELVCSRQTSLPLCSCVISSLYLLSPAESLVTGLRS